MRVRILSIGVALATLALGACGGSPGESSNAGGQGDQGVQVVQIKALDTLRFEPSSVTVKAGKPVRFVVTNSGKTDHELVIGDREMQEEHEKEMAEEAASTEKTGGGMSMGDMREVELKPGETKSLTVTFDRPATTMYGCHEPGHYPGGMVGTITIVR